MSDEVPTHAKSISIRDVILIVACIGVAFLLWDAKCNKPAPTFDTSHDLSTSDSMAVLRAQLDSAINHNNRLYEDSLLAYRIVNDSLNKTISDMKLDIEAFEKAGKAKIKKIIALPFKDKVKSVYESVQDTSTK